MTVQLKPDLQKFITEQVSAGRFRSAEEVVEAGLVVLRQQEKESDFAPGELDKLLAEGDADIEHGRLHDGEAFFRELAEKSRVRREQSR